MSIVVNIYYSGENGSARKFAKEMISSGTVDAIRKSSSPNSNTILRGFSDNLESLFIFLETLSYYFVLVSINIIMSILHVVVHLRQ